MISLEDISKIYHDGQDNEVAALQQIRLYIRKGEYVVLIGANGSGKTTLLNMIAGTGKVSSGKVIFDGVDVTRFPEYKRSKWIARVFQNPYTGTSSELSILDNFRLAALRTKRKKLIIGIDSAFRKRVRDMISKLDMGLENKTDQLMGSLSGGQRQALTLLMSVMDDASILLMDEPTAALDPKSASQILRLANQIILEYKLTAILITHNLKEAQQNGNRLIQFQEGRIRRDIPEKEKSEISLTDMLPWFE